MRKPLAAPPKPGASWQHFARSRSGYGKPRGRRRKLDARLQCMPLQSQPSSRRNSYDPCWRCVPAERIASSKPHRRETCGFAAPRIDLHRSWPPRSRSFHRHRMTPPTWRHRQRQTVPRTHQSRPKPRTSAATNAWRHAYPRRCGARAGGKASPAPSVTNHPAVRGSSSRRIGSPMVSTSSRSATSCPWFSMRRARGPRR